VNYCGEFIHLSADYPAIVQGDVDPHAAAAYKSLKSGSL
jgi:hypothetical protein